MIQVTDIYVILSLLWLETDPKFSWGEDIKKTVFQPRFSLGISAVWEQYQQYVDRFIEKWNYRMEFSEISDHIISINVLPLPEVFLFTSWTMK